MKKCLIGFIVLLTSFMIFNDHIKADEFKANGFTFNTEEIEEIILDKYNIDIENQYYYKYAFINNNKLYYIVDRRFQGCEIGTSNFISRDISNTYIKNDNYVRTFGFGSGGFGASGDGLYNIYAYIYDFSTSTYVVESAGWSKSYIIGNIDSNNMTSEEILNYYKEKFVYSNTNIALEYISSGVLSVYLPYDYFTVTSKIDISKNLAQDLDNVNFYLIRANFENIYDPTYKYQMKINDDEWIDISKYIHELAKEGYYFYDYDCYFNYKISYRVLNSADEVIDEAFTEVNELSDVSIEGYKRFSVQPNILYVFVSGVTEGSIYWLTSIEQKYEPQLFYVDPSLDKQPNYHYIDGKNIHANYTPSLTSQSFNISDMPGSKLVGIDLGYDFENLNDLNHVFEFWAPEDAHISFVTFDVSLDGGDLNIEYEYDYIDPETGELIHVGSSEVSDRSFFRNFTDALNYFKDSIICIFQNVSYFFNSLPIALKYFFMIIFVFILFIFLIRFIL